MFRERKQHKKLIPSVKRGGSFKVWACFMPASGPGWLVIIDGTMNSELYQQNHESQEKVGHAARQPKNA